MPNQTNATQLKNVVAIIEDGVMKFYIADDEELTCDVSKACAFDTMDEAIAESIIINRMWDLSEHKMFAVCMHVA